MRILLLHNRYRSAQPSGENRVVDDEAALLTAGGHHVDLFGRRNDDIASMTARERYTVPLRVPWNPATRTELAARLRIERPDVVHIHNTFPLLSPSVLTACAETGVPIVATLHNYAMVCPTGTLYRDGHICTDCAGRLPFPAVRHGCYRESKLATVPVAANAAFNKSRWRSTVARFFCVSHSQRSILIGAGMPADRLVVKHNFVHEPTALRTGSGKHMLYIGRMAAEKGVRQLMQAWDLVAAAGQVDVPLILAGSGPLEREVASWATNRDDVRYLGLRNKQQCNELIAESAAIVMPSVWPETFGLVLIEAMAAGVPALAAAHGSVVELVENGVTGLHHRPGDPAELAACIRRMLADREQNVSMGRAARHRYLRGFTPEIALERLVAGYREAIDATV
jgi:glycosyltransferase involved in cell wall biosynthesis